MSHKADLLRPQAMLLRGKPLWQPHAFRASFPLPLSFVPLGACPSNIPPNEIMLVSSYPQLHW